MVTTRLFTPLIRALLLCGIATLTAVGQDSNSPQSSPPLIGWNAGPGNAREMTVSGTIQQVVTTHTAGSPAGLHILIESSKGVVNVSAGPFVRANLQQALSVGRAIQVTGIERMFGGQNYLLARQLVVGGRQITIRNEHGFLVSAPSDAGSTPHRKQGAPNGGVQ